MRAQEAIRTLGPMRILRRATMLSLLLAATVPTMVSAHATLLSSTPAADQTITTLPSTILLTFDDVLTTDSNFVVLGSAGLTVATGSLDPTDSKSLTAPMPSLGDGTYQVRWTAISADDGFIERGSFQFTVATASAGPSGAAGSPGSSDVVASTVAPGSIPSTATGGDSPGQAGDVLIPIIIVAAAVAIGLAWFLRRRPSA